MLPTGSSSPTDPRAAIAVPSTASQAGGQVHRSIEASFAVRVGGVAGLLLVALVVAQILLPTLPNPALERILNTLPLLAVAVWFIGIDAVQRPRLGRLGRLGTAAAITGLMGIAAIDLLAAFARSGGGVSAFLSGPGMSPISATIAVLYVWGILALGTDSLRAGVLARGATVLWMVGLLAALFTTWLPVPMIATAGILWSSLRLLRAWGAAETERAADVRPVPAEGIGRLIPLDALRGLIMILMAIDHASYFVRHWHPFETWDQPLPDYPSLAAMLTRLATHPCAPGFYFLMGAGMLLFARARRQIGWSEGRIAGHLALRGLLLIAVEQLIVDLATAGQVYPFEFSILAGLGAVMLLGILCLRFSGKAQAAIGAAIILVMQFLPGLLLHAELGIFTPIRLLVLPGSVGSAFVLYPPVPWLGVTLLGTAFARLLLSRPDRAYRWALPAGAAGLGVFVLLRLLGGFGNLRMPEGNTLVDFLNVVKYPPSLSFLFLALGFDLVMLYAFSRSSRWLTTWARPLVILGQGALYFFLVHWFLYRALSLAWPTPAGLPQTYLAWGLGLVVLYPVCKAYESFKHSMPVESVWRMI